VSTLLLVAMMPKAARHRPETMSDRRQRIHELVLALLAGIDDLELLDGVGVLSREEVGTQGGDPAGWLERNRRLVHRYQALVRSAATLDALIDQEVFGGTINDGG
jgi:hypothetical protein